MLRPLGCRLLSVTDDIIYCTKLAGSCMPRGELYRVHAKRAQVSDGLSITILQP